MPKQLVFLKFPLVVNCKICHEGFKFFVMNFRTWKDIQVDFRNLSQCKDLFS